MLEFDDFVPLQFSSYKELLGAGYLRLGNYSTTLLELAVDPHSQVLRGLTVTLIALLSPWPSFSISKTLEGFPVLATDFEGWKVVDLKGDFEVSARRNEVIVFWGDLGLCEAYAFDRMRFLVRDRALVGVWFQELTESEVELFRSHATASED